MTVRRVDVRLVVVAHRHAVVDEADRMAEERIASIGKIKLPTMGNNGPRFLGRMRGQ